MKPNIEQLSKEYAKGVTKNETYQEYLEKAVIVGAKAMEEYYEAQQQEIWNAARGANYTTEQAITGIKWDYPTLEDYLKTKGRLPKNKRMTTNILYRVFTRRNLADTSRDPDDIRIKELGYFKEEGAAKKAAEEYIKNDFLNKDTKLSKTETGEYTALDFCSYGESIYVSKIEVQ